MSQSKPSQYLLIFDWETGGLNSQKNPVVELAMIAVRIDNFEEIGRIDDIVVPYNKKGEVISYDFDSFMIRDVNKKAPKEEQDIVKESNKVIEEAFDFVYTEGAAKIHKVNESDMMLRGIEIGELVDKIIKLGSASKVNNFSKAILVGHNPDFDRNFIQQVFNVTGKAKEMPKIFAGSEDYYGNFQPHMIDTMDLSKLKWHKNEEEISGYSLSACINKSGLDLIGAHRAINDVVATKDLLLHFKKSLRSNEISSDNEYRFRDSFKFEF